MEETSKKINQSLYAISILFLVIFVILFCWVFIADHKSELARYQNQQYDHIKEVVSTAIDNTTNPQETSTVTILGLEWINCVHSLKFSDLKKDESGTHSFCEFNETILSYINQSGE